MRAKVLTRIGRVQASTRCNESIIAVWLIDYNHKLNAEDNTADPESDALWAELDSLELALV